MWRAAGAGREEVFGWLVCSEEVEGFEQVVEDAGGAVSGAGFWAGEESWVLVVWFGSLLAYFGKKARMKIARKMEVLRRLVSNGI